MCMRVNWTRLLSLSLHPVLWCVCSASARTCGQRSVVFEMVRDVNQRQSLCVLRCGVVERAKGMTPLKMHAGTLLVLQSQLDADECDERFRMHAHEDVAHVASVIVVERRST